MESAAEPDTAADSGEPMAPGQLIRARKFFPYFLTQFLGAFNDNVYKNALIGLLTYQYIALGVQDGKEVQLINFSAGLFILPFFLFSATAGQIAEKYEKSMLIRRIKMFEICIMVVGAIAVMTYSLNLLFVVLVMMGTQSSFFGPIKYSILPQHLQESELIGGNGLVEAGTFLAILIGMIIGGLLVNVPEYGTTLVAGLVILLAILGWLSSRQIPAAPPSAPDLKVNWNFVVETVRIINHARGNRMVFLAIMGISWFWFYGSFFLAQVPGYGKVYLGGTQSVVTLLMAMFTIGIAAGSLLCSRLSGRSVEIGLVPLGAVGMTLFAIDLSFASPATPAVGELISATELLRQPSSWRVLADLAGIAVSGGLYIVPLYAMVQTRSESGHLSRTIATVNIINALFMVGSAVVAIVLLRVGLSVPQLFLVIALMNIAIAVFIFTLVPEFIMRLIVWALMHTMYRLDTVNLRNIPLRGRAVLVCNHVSYVDALIIASASRRPVRFMMYHKIFETPVLSFVFRTSRAIPVAPAKEDAELLEKAYETVAQELEDDNIVCLFPEGKLTSDGEMSEFRSGVERIVARTPAPVIPMALKGLWGSFFSRKEGKLAQRLRRGVFSRIELIVGDAVEPQDVDKDDLYRRVLELRGDAR